MANVQLQRPATVTRTAVDQKQSLEVVQTILHGGLSNLFFVRGFFPEKAFLERVYGAEDMIPSYQDYASGNLPPTKSRGGTNIRLLRRGSCKRVDGFLDWLERDAFSALKSGNLQALQVFVHPDASNPNQIIESYTFTVKYDTNEQSRQVASAVEVRSPGSAPVTIGATSGEVQNVLRQVHRLHDTLPELPEQRFVSMRMTYITDNNVPEGWTPSSSDRLLLGRAEGWVREQETIGDVSSSFHQTAFEISHLQHHRRKIHAGKDPLPMPKLLQYAEELPALPEQDLAPAIDHTASKLAQCQPDDDSAALARSHFADEPPQTIPTQSLGRMTTSNNTSDGKGSRRASIPSRRSARLSSQQQIADTQTSNGTEMRDAFRSFMLPETYTQGDTQTQAPSFTAPAPSETTASPSRGERSPIVAGHAANPSNHKLALSQTAAERLQRLKQQKRRHSGSKSRKSKHRGTERDVVTCECEFTEEEGCMIYCTACDTWQHSHCYGFTGQDDPRIPDDHVCYKCLLGQAEPQTLRSLYSLMQKRRVMHFLSHESGKRPSEIAASIQISASEAEDIIDRFRHEGYVVAAKTAKKASSSIMNAYSAIKTGHAHEKMQRDLFDPLLLISHHYQIPGADKPSSSSKHLFEGPPGDMPPPTTPASRLVKHVRTPGTGLDLRQSMTPFETPVMSQSRQRSGTKRRREDQLEHAVNKRQARSVQTQFMLDTSALPSSPA